MYQGRTRILICPDAADYLRALARGELYLGVTLTRGNTFFVTNQGFLWSDGVLKVESGKRRGNQDGLEAVCANEVELGMCICRSGVEQNLGVSIVLGPIRFRSTANKVIAIMDTYTLINTLTRTLLFARLLLLTLRTTRLRFLGSRGQVDHAFRLLWHCDSRGPKFPKPAICSLLVY